MIENTLTIQDLTKENLKILVDISNSYNEFVDDHLTKDFEKALRAEMAYSTVFVNLMSVYLVILYHSNFELYKVKEFEEEALDFIFNKNLKEMPLYINQTTGYNWIPIVARWRLTIGR
jgi:hypothetical protein